MDASHRRPFSAPLPGLAWILFTLMLCACAVNPATGRRQVVLMNSQKEIEIGAQAAEQVEQQMGRVEDEALESYVAAVGERLAAHSPRRDVPYSFRIVDLPEANAFALPGGHIYVSRGLLAITNSEDELANVLAHEIGHVAALHHAQQQTRRAGVGLLVLPARVVGGIVGGTVGDVIETPFNLAGQGVIAAHGRDQEREADQLGQRIAAKAGYDPIGLSDFLTTLEKENSLQEEGEGTGLHFFDTHPSTPERVETTRADSGEIEWTRVAELSPGRRAFLARLDGLLLGTNPAEGVFEGSRFLHPDLDFALAFPEGWTLINQRNLVAAEAPDGRARLVLEIASHPGPPAEAADAFFAELSEAVRFERGEGEAFTLGGAPAYHVVAALRGNGQVYLDLTWVEHEGLIFRLTGAAPARSFDATRRHFVASAASFRRLSDEQRASLQVTRLRVAVSRAGESLSDVSDRVGNAWSLPETAVANELPAVGALPPDEPVKVAIPEPVVLFR
ncbi:M48 family metalloprotease [Myxococcota bacterium]|nr:M48 family metalloprotease [Myxococcota bacterium]